MSTNYPPLAFAKAISDKVNAAWEDGSFLENVTPTTQNLLKYWFDPAYIDLRDVNFHEGQRQAIMNIIYIHEILKKDKILDVYSEIAPQLLLEPGSDLRVLGDKFYNYPKYCVKMATGTGKTWVLEALLIWQYLNARHEDGNYTKNFLIVAPGLIVYDRLLDAFLGRNKDNGESRDFETSDLKRQQDLFIPENYRNEVFGFLQSSVAAKTEIGSKVTGDGIIAITNFHLLMGADEQEKSDSLDSWSLPVAPGVSAGNSLDVLDNSLNGKKELEYLRSLPNLMMINDEAHHIHENKKGGQIDAVEWQKSLQYIADTKGNRCIQVDFSATPYAQRGKEKIYFPHIVTDFELERAIEKGYVKTIVLDERKELNVEALDYKVIRDGRGRATDLSDGQRQMLRAGIAKLKLLENEFIQVDETKIPKMLVMCEDTEVVPLVADFLRMEGVDDDDILEIHSNKKGEVGEDQWNEMKQKLFALDKYKKPRIVISVLMLREGFDVNNICVIVPLRSSQSNILLEQTIGRGLRLMWRGNKEIDELKAENRHRIMIERKSATNYFDVLSIVEHPAFRDFYKELLDKGLIGEESEDENETKAKGDMLAVELRENYQQYDFRLPTIIQEAVAEMRSLSDNVMSLEPYPLSLEAMQKFVPDHEQWRSVEITKDVHFGDFDVTSGVFRASSYNDYLARIVSRLADRGSQSIDAVSSSRRTPFMPMMSINRAELAQVVDKYIRHRLFNCDIDPAENNIWKVLLISHVINHISGVISKLIIEAQESENITSGAKVIFNNFSKVNRIMVRENYCLDVVKCIYPTLPYPSNKGQYEHDFTLFADHDGEVDAFCKVIEQRHTFARFRYVREDGLPAEYIPDFFVRFGNDVFIVEAKASKDMSAENVKRKQRAAISWTKKINELSPEERENIVWHYSILSDNMFYEWKHKNATLREMLDYAELRNESVYAGRLF